MDVLYGGTALAWIGQAGSTWYNGSAYVAKSGSTMTGDLNMGTTNNLINVKDVKSSNAVFTNNVYCGNVLATYHIGDGSKLNNLDLSLNTNFGTNIPSGTAVLGKAGTTTQILGTINADMNFGAATSISQIKDIKFSNALMGTNTTKIFCGDVNCAAGSKFYGDGSALTGVVASSTDTTSAFSICTVPTSGTLRLGTALVDPNVIQIGALNVATAPQVKITGGPTGLSLVGGIGGVNLNSTGVVNIQQNFQAPVNIGFNNGGAATNPTTIYASSLVASLNHSISTTATHTAMTKGLMQTAILSLSGEQGPISTTSGSGILPTVLFRVPFSWSIYGARLSCLQASTSGPITVDIQSFNQNTTISGATVNSTQGSSLFGAAKLNIDVLKYSSVGSTNIANNGVLATTPTTVADDSLLGVFILANGTSVLGLKLVLFYTL
jgi:hypothetical protein